MTFVDLDDLPAADPVPSERVMLRSLIHSLAATEAQIGALQAHQAMLYTAVTEVVELQTSRLRGAARRDREMPLREVTAEIAAALRVTERTVQRRMSEGDDVADAVHPHLHRAGRRPHQSDARQRDRGGRLFDRR